MFLTYESFVIFAMKVYDNPSCKTIDEFEDDLNNFNTLVRLCAKDHGDHAEQLLNVVLTILNIFSQQEAIEMMFFKVKRKNWRILKTILTYLQRMPEQIPELQLIDSDIPICLNTAEQLRKI